MSLTIGIDVGGTKVLGGVVDESGNILEKARRDTPRQGGAELTQTIADVALELMRNHKVSAVGVSAAGFVSSDRKTMLATPNIAGWNGVNLDDELTKLIGIDVVIENDGNAAAWGEAVFGAGRGEAHMLLLTIGTGIGAGIVVNGQLHRGAFGIAAEIGHMRVIPEGHLCGCGARGCFEQYASGSGLMRHVREAIAATPDIARNLLALEEELGFRLANLRFMTTVYMTPGAVTERLSLFIADYDHDARIGAGGGAAHEGEDIEVLEVSFDEMRRMVQDGRIVDAKTVMLSLFLERELGLPPL